MTGATPDQPPPSDVDPDIEGHAMEARDAQIAGEGVDAGAVPETEEIDDAVDRQTKMRH